MQLHDKQLVNNCNITNDGFLLNLFANFGENTEGPIKIKWTQQQLYQKIQNPNIFSSQPAELWNANYIVHGSPWKEPGTPWPPNRLKMELDQEYIPRLY